MSNPSQQSQGVEIPEKKKMELKDLIPSSLSDKAGKVNIIAGLITKTFRKFGLMKPANEIIEKNLPPEHPEVVELMTKIRAAFSEITENQLEPQLENPLFHNDIARKVNDEGKTVDVAKNEEKDLTRTIFGNVADGITKEIRSDRIA